MLQSSEQGSGIPGILRPFKEYLEKAHLSDETQVIFFGLPGTCLPFVELLCYAVRSLPIIPIFVPGLDISQARKMIYHKEAGFQIGERVVLEDSAVFVLMGGLSMPASNITVQDAEAFIKKYNPISILGICFMSMFEKTGWTARVSFDLLIDATVTVEIFINQ